MSFPDYPLGETLDFKFSTRSFTTGAPTTLAGTPSVAIYEDNSTTEITAGVTLTVDFDGVTGLSNLRIVATSGNGFASGSSYHAVISSGTVGGVSVVGEVVAQFSIERSPALRPTTAGRTLDVTATGAAGIDWGNVENPSTAVDLSATDIQLCDSVVTNLDMRGTDDALLASSAPSNFGDLSISAGTGRVDVGSIEGVDATDQITTSCNASIVNYGLDHLVSAAVVGTDVTDNSIVAFLASKAATADWDTFDNTTDSLEAIADSAAGGGPTPGDIADAVWDEDATAHQILGSFGQAIGDPAANSKTLYAAMITDAGSGLTDLGGMSNGMKAEVNAEMVDVLDVDTFNEPGQGQPGATISLAQKIGYIYKFLRNRVTSTATTISVFSDNETTVDHKSTHSDDGTTYDRGEFRTGP